MIHKPLQTNKEILNASLHVPYVGKLQHQRKLAELGHAGKPEGPISGNRVPRVAVGVDRRRSCDPIKLADRHYEGLPSVIVQIGEVRFPALSSTPFASTPHPEPMP